MINRLGKIWIFHASLVHLLVLNSHLQCATASRMASAVETAALGRPVTAQERNFLRHTGIQPLDTEAAPDQMRLFLFGQIALF